MSDAFDQMFFRAIDPTVQIDGRPVPMGTTLLYRVCKEDQTLFEEALRLMRIVFDDAIAAEREACAKIAEGFDIEGVRNHGSFIARKIRTQNEHDPKQAIDGEGYVR